jgi:Na+/proline symporter
VLIWIYTFRGGIKTIVWTDTFQTLFLVSAVAICVYIIATRMGLSFSGMVWLIESSHYTKMFYFDDPNSTLFFPKQFFGGAFIAITMTGMDQEIMQKNLTCKSIREAQKNMFWFSLTLVVVNLLFLTLGALLYLYSEKNGLVLPAASDELFPRMALNEFGTVAGVFFLLGIIASSYASADSALAGLTTSFCIDFLNFKSKDENQKQRQKFVVHLAFSLLFLVIILIFKEINERSVIDAVLNVAAYTYGPLLGLFAFGLSNTRSVRDRLVPLICVLSPALSFVISTYSPQWLGGYQFGVEILILNGMITYGGLLAISSPGSA